MNNLLNQLEKILNINFTNKLLLENVFIHRSFLNEHKNYHLPSNEKLEFLGDSVLSLTTTIYLYNHYPELDEGKYTDIKASIVRTESLAEAAVKIDLGRYLFLSKGETTHQGRANTNLLADCFEALVGAIFIEKGFKTAYNFIVSYLFKDKVNIIVQNKLYLSPKSRLQEYAQAKYRKLPDYRVVSQKGPEHSKQFIIDLYINNLKMSTGKGKSKKIAEEEAAKNALEKLNLI